MARAKSLRVLLKEVRGCTVCAEHLPLGPRPVLRVGIGARILVVGQAPGTKVHESGVPWDDDSGKHLREWLDVEEEFSDPDAFGILPMGFCYPGKRTGGDLPPRPECAPLWHPTLRATLADVRLTLLVGRYAQKYYLGKLGKRTLTETVRAYRAYLPEYFPLPHPSWRSRGWIRRNPWFSEELLPELRREIRGALR